MVNEGYKLSADCYYCNNHLEWPDSENLEVPQLVKCDLCGKLLMNVFCKKCGVGGVIVPEVSSSSLGAVGEFVKKPSFWMCNDCKNKWEISAKTYDSPLMGKSTLSVEEQQKIKGNFRDKGLKVEQKGPNYLAIYFISLVTSLISTTLAEVAAVAIVWWSFTAFLNKRSLWKVVGILLLGFLSSSALKLIIGGLVLALRK